MKLYFIIICSLCFTLTSCSQSADYIFSNAKIYSADDQNTFYEAMAIVDNSIIALGSIEEINSYKGNQTISYDLEGKLILPGLHDVHMHPLEASSLAFGDCILDSYDDIETLASTIASCDLQANSNGWRLAYGHSIFSILDSTIPSKEYLDNIFPDDPILVYEETSHSMWVNSAALDILGITDDTPDPVGGHIYKHWSTGEVDGLLMDNAGDAALQLALAPTQEILDFQYDGLVGYGLPLLARNGITSICEGRTYYKQNFIETWQQIHDDGLLTARVNLAPWIYPNDFFNEQLHNLQDLYDPGNEFLSIDQIKCYSDGIVINATAALHEPYNDNLGLPFNTGLNYLNESSLTNYITELEKTGYNFHIHTLGDRGVTEALNAIETAQSINGNLGNRHRLTHLEIVDQQDYSRFVELGVVADMQVAAAWTQPNAWAQNIPLIGVERSQNYIPLKNIFDTGARVTLSSDWDVSTVNPFVGMQNAITRFPQNLPSIEHAIKAYTINAAFVTGRDDITGSLELGKRADFIITNQDIFSIPEDDISSTLVLSTWLDGEEIFNNFDFVSNTVITKITEGLTKVHYVASKDQIYIDVLDPSTTVVELFDQNGSLIKSKNLINKSKTIISTSKLPAATYIIRSLNKIGAVQTDQIVIID